MHTKTARQYSNQYFLRFKNYQPFALIVQFFLSLMPKSVWAEEEVYSKYIYIVYSISSRLYQTIKKILCTISQEFFFLMMSY